MSEKFLVLLKPGVTVLFLTPRMGTWQQRRLIVHRVQDTSVEPLDPLVAERIPISCRGRWAVTGLDEDRGEDRTFFVEWMEKIELIDENAERFEIVLCDDECTAEKVTDAPNFRAACHFMREWLNEPLGLIVGLRKVAVGEVKSTAA